MGKFNSVFNKKNVVEQQKAIRKYFNEDAPNGYEYKEISPNMFALRSKKSNEKVSFTVRIKFPFEFEGLHVTSIDKLLDAMYRTQKSYEVDSQLQMKEPSVIKLVGGKIKNQLLLPQKFQEAGTLDISWSSHKITSKLKRVPLASYTKTKLELEKPGVLNIDLLIDEKNSSMKVMARLNFDRLKTINDYFEHRDLIEAFYKGNIEILGRKTGLAIEEYEVFEKNDCFYEALKLLQEKFDIEFIFPHKIKNSEFFNTKILYESIVNNRLVKIEGSETYRFQFDKDKTNVLENKHLIDKHQHIFIEIPLEITLLNNKINIMQYILYTDLIMEKIVQETNEVVYKSADSNIVYYYYGMVENPILEEVELMKKSAVEFKKIDFKNE